MNTLKEKYNELYGLDTGDYGEELANYGGSSYINDNIIEIADSNTSIYYSDIMEFIKNNDDWCNRALDEFGADGCDNDIYKIGQTGEFMSIQEDLYSHIDDNIINAICENEQAFVHDVCIKLDAENIEKLLDDICNDHLCYVDGSMYDRLDSYYEDLETFVNDWMGENGFSLDEE
jgi:hypothetical protein